MTTTTTANVTPPADCPPQCGSAGAKIWRRDDIEAWGFLYSTFRWFIGRSGFARNRGGGTDG